jgi:hypothetical protein
MLQEVQALQEARKEELDKKSEGRRKREEEKEIARLAKVRMSPQAIQSNKAITPSSHTTIHFIYRKRRRGKRKKMKKSDCSKNTSNGNIYLQLKQLAVRTSISSRCDYDEPNVCACVCVCAVVCVPFIDVLRFPSFFFLPFPSPCTQESPSLLQEFIDYIKRQKVVVLEDLASQFGMKTQVSPRLPFLSLIAIDVFTFR